MQNAKEHSGEVITLTAVSADNEMARACAEDVYLNTQVLFMQLGIEYVFRCAALLTDPELGRHKAADAQRHAFQAAHKIEIMSGKKQDIFHQFDRPLRSIYPENILNYFPHFVNRAIHAHLAVRETAPVNELIKILDAAINDPFCKLTDKDGLIELRTIIADPTSTSRQKHIFDYGEHEHSQRQVEIITTPCAELRPYFVPKILPFSAFAR